MAFHKPLFDPPFEAARERANCEQLAVKPHPVRIHLGAQTVSNAKPSLEEEVHSIE